MSPVQSENYIIEEECTFHKQVEWVVKFVPNVPVRLTSPEFEIMSQHYKLELSSDSSSWTDLLLYRRGPSFDSISRYVPWWAGLKRTDGTYNDRNLKGELELRNACKTWTMIRLHRISEFELLNHVHGESLIVFFRLHLERRLATAQECTHGAAMMSARGTGTIREEECSSHKHVEWVITTDMLQKRKNLMTPNFMIGTRSYKLELSFCSDKLFIHLYSKEPPIASAFRPNRWWAGMKFSNETYVRGYDGRGTLNLKKECDIWTQKSLFTVKEGTDDLYIPFIFERLIVFFRLSFERASTIPDMCNHAPTIITSLDNRGIIRRENRSSFQHVEWEIPTEHRYNLMRSPEFATRSQYHELELCMDSLNLKLNLCSRGPSVGPSRTARWWAGFKRSDGTCILSITSGIMDLQELCEFWTQKCLYSIRRYNLGEEINRKFTVFFRMNVQQATTAAEAYVHDNTVSAAPCGGNIQEVECASHRQVEWIVSPWDRAFHMWISSPAFTVETQEFKFEVFVSESMNPSPDLFLRLDSKGPSVAGPCRPVRWCAGLKRNDGTYQHKILRGELDLTEACELWTLRGLVKFPFSEFASDESTFFFRLEKETAEMSWKTCIHGNIEVQTKGFGEIKKQELPSYEQVEWTIDYDCLSKDDQNFSSEFFIRTQSYILELSQDSDTLDSMTLCLYKRGSSVAEPSRFARWWAGLKRGNRIYHHRNQRGELDLNEECELWTQIYLHRVCRYELERELLASDNTVTVFFRLSMEQTAKVCTQYGGEYLQDIKWSGSDVVFQVKDAEFVMPKDILEVRTSFYKAMFHHDTIENASGVVTIKDFEPAIFEKFLHYISFGFVRELTVCNAFDLYIIADKYLVDDLKAECLQCLTESLSLDNFCDIVTLALRHHETDFLKEAADFLSGNKSITTTEEWKTLCSDNPTETNDLLHKAFSHLFFLPECEQ